MVPGRTVCKAGIGCRWLLLLLCACLCPWSTSGEKALPQTRGAPAVGMLIGAAGSHAVSGRETLLDIARQYDLGINELQALYPEMDPWLPKAGTLIIIPSQRILPDAPRQGIVINIPELRLYFYSGTSGQMTVRTYPVGIGDLDFPTPVGTFTIGSRRERPAWHIPPSLRAKYGIKVMPPGEGNPLGDFWLGLSGQMYGIHGTDLPWSVGRLVTHGCIRLYPEDIARLYPLVRVGTEVNLVYQPVKVACRGGRVYLEVHRDVYGRLAGLREHAVRIIARACLDGLVDHELLLEAVIDQAGIPRDITAGPLSQSWW